MEFVKLSLDYVPQIFLWHREHFDKIGFDKPPSLKETNTLIEGWVSDESKIVFLIKHNEEFIGYVALFNINKHHGIADLHTLIGDKRYLGHKVCVEVIDAILKLSFEGLGLHRVTTYIMGDNPRLIKTARRYGFIQEGIMREALNKNNNRVDYYIFSMLRTDRRRNVCQ